MLTDMGLTVSEEQQPPPQVALCHRDSQSFGGYWPALCPEGPSSPALL